MSNYRVSDEEVAFIIERRPFLSTDHALASDLRFARTKALNMLNEIEDCRDAHMEAWALLKEVRDTFAGNDADGAPGADGSYWLGHSLALKIHWFLNPRPDHDPQPF